ncbi:hypothetical protein ACQKOE_13915 [Novosphingobium sp. NPDC080210]|uniref:hypothetical protein n=1 Tax=Novosphingobium sp. NPDC080210 TaxID=3390596 RepID=UPI003CFCCF88
MIHVSQHALDRYRERIANLSDDEIRAALITPAVMTAAAIGARFVRIASGHRIALADYTITTILPPDHFRKQVLRTGLARFGKTAKAHRREHYRGGLHGDIC